MLCPRVGVGSQRQETASARARTLSAWAIAPWVRGRLPGRARTKPLQPACYIHALVPRRGTTMAILEAGTPAPAFKLHVTADQQLSSDELRGNRYVLAFYPADFSPVCG